MDFINQMFESGIDPQQAMQEDRMRDNAMHGQSIYYLNQRIDNLVARIATLEEKLNQALLSRE